MEAIYTYVSKQIKGKSSKIYCRLSSITVVLCLILGAAAVIHAQTVTITSTKSTELYKKDATKNYGSCQGIGPDNATTYQVNPLIQFDLSAIPAGATITSATLRMVHAPNGTGFDNESGSAFTSIIRRVTTAWDEGNSCNATGAGATWNTPGSGSWTGGNYAATNYGTLTAGAPDAPGTVYNITITSLVQEWYNGTSPNNGLGIVPATLVGDKSESWYYMYSDDATTASNRPQLIVNYSLSPVGGTAGKTDACIGVANGTITVTNPTGGSGTYQYSINSGAWQSSNVFNVTAGNYTVQIRDANNTSNQTTLTPNPLVVGSLPDSDGDSISNDCDLDDDNDGILDTDEGSSIQLDLRTGTTAVGTNDPKWTVTWASPTAAEVSVLSGISTPGFDYTLLANYAPPIGTFPVQAAVIGNVVPAAWLNAPSGSNWISYIFTGANNGPGNHTNADADGNLNEGSPGTRVGTGDYVLLKFSTTVNIPAGYNPSGISLVLNTVSDNYSAFYVNGVYNAPVGNNFSNTTPITLSSGWQVGTNTIEVRVFSGPGYAGFAAIGLTQLTFDTDGDGIVNSLDTDSDGDGCADAIEGGGSFTAANIDANGRLTGGVGTNGVPTTAGAGQTVGGSQVATQVVILTPPGNQAVGAAAPATFSISARGDNATSYSSGTPGYGTAGNSNAGLTYQWYLGDPDAGGTALTNAGVYSGVTSATLNISNSAGLHGNNYFVLVRHSSNDCIRLKRSAALTLFCGSITASVVSQTNINCLGASTGAVTVTGSNGVAPYTYKLGSGAFVSSGTFSNLTAGAYTVTVKDAGGCEQTVNFIITQPSAALAVSQSTVQPQCFASGSITPTVTGGTAPYTYDWADIAGTNNTGNRTGLAAGTYNLTVIDSKGCTVSTGNIVLNAPINCDPIDICRSSVAEVFSVAPDPANISYTWTVPAGAFIVSGQGTPQITVNWTGVTPGTYQVCVVAVNNCNESAQTCINVDVIQPTAQASVVLPICKDKTINLMATGGVSYSWTGPNGFTSSGANPTILNANAATHNGTYTVVVTDASGCKATATVNVTVEDNPVLTTASITNATCNQSNGAINITVSGGTPAYNYSWNNGATTEDLTNLSSGSYTLTVTDSKGCFQSSTVAVISTNGPTVTNVKTNVTCNGASTGSITVTVTGGTAPYTYLWSDGATTKDRTGLVAGTYSVTVTDATGCVSTTTATITQPAGIVLDHVKTNVACFGGLTGSIDLSVSGGTLPYSYAWTRNSVSFSGNIQDQSSIGAGTYQVTVTDANNCTATQTIVITQPSAALNATRAISNVSCRNGTNGQIVLTVTGGTAPYTYAWTGTNSFTATTKDIINRPAGTYNVTITDANGCTFPLVNMVITQPSSLIAVAPVAITNVLCFGDGNGSIDVTATGGTPPYTYGWNTGATTQDISGLNPGSYNVAVTDANGCSVTSNIFTVSGPTAPISAIITPTDADCFGASTGQISLVSGGGTPTYTYLWSNASTSQNLFNLPAGDYSVTVKDANLCTQVFTTSVGQPTQTIITGAITNALCSGSATGAITVSVTGGSSPYTYKWADGPTSQNRTNLIAGNYTLEVTDNTGCKVSKTFTISNTSSLSLSSITTSISCFGNNNGRVNLIVTGGVAPVTFSWSANANNATTEDISGLPAGTYSVTVSDAIGCVKTLTASPVTQPALLTATASQTKSVSCKGGSNGEATVVPSGGTAPYTYNWSNGAMTATATGLQAGTYNVFVTDANGCTATASVVITEPANEIELFVTVSNNSSCSVNKGAIDLIIQNGVAPFTYVWTGPTAIGNVQDPSNLLSGAYSVIVTDALGCSSSIATTVSSAPALSVSVSVENRSCQGIDGKAFSVVTGGVGPYTYSWSPGGITTKDLTGLSSGTYTVTVTDANNCTATASGTLIAPNCQPPVAVDDPYTTPFNTPVSGTVASNDSDPDNTLSELSFDPLAAPLASQGTIVWDITGNGSFTFTPALNFVGVVTIPYRVCDPTGLCDDANLIITVSARPPVAADDFNNTPINTPVSGNVLTNDDDPQGLPLTVNTTIPTICPPKHGTVVMQANGNYTYTPTNNFVGTDNFCYVVCSSIGLCDTATVTIDIIPLVTKNSVVANDDATQTQVGIPVKIRVLANDFDPQGDKFASVTKITNPANGTVVYNPADSSFTYSPTGAFVGKNSFKYLLCDVKGACDTATVTVDVLPLIPGNDPPVAIDDANITKVNVPVSGTVATNDSDPNNDPLTFTKLTNPAHGTVVFNPNGIYIYTPTTNYAGPDRFIYKVCDNGTPNLCDTATVYITILVAPPVATDDINNTPINTPVSGNVLTNDDDPQGLPLTVNTAIPTICPPQHGTVVMQANGNYTYTPTNNFVGTDKFCYVVCNSAGLCDTAIVTIDILPPITTNNVVANDDATQTQVGIPVKIRVLANDFDPQGDKFASVTKITNPANGTVVYNPADSSFTYSPTGAFVGKNSFKYLLCDVKGACDTATVTIDVLPLIPGNDPPVAVDDANVTQVNVPVSGTVATNDSDPNNDPLTFTKLTNPTNGTVTFNPNGTYTYTPNNNYVGPDRFIYKVCDNGTPNLCDTATVYITILQVSKVAVLPKVYLQGSLFGVFSGTLMRDDLRVKNLIPRKSPYVAWNPITPADTITSNTVLTVTGQDAIVDWVFVELRSATDSTKIIDSRSALVQRDGDIVDVDGTSSIVFTNAIPASYFVVVKHRNHLGVMTKNALPLTLIGTVVDFRLTTTPTYVFSNSLIFQSQVNVVQGKALWAGNALYDDQVINQGTGNDVNVVYQQVIGAMGNVIGLPFFILQGYYTGDINMDGEVILQGTNNDVEYIYQNVINNHPGNILKQNFFIIQQQLPK
ncbi:Ig-like domain-containing protein [Runella sp.]|uniref:Ig-like domain-containing protein n=1 Tax=Runella sp. TaxID=1960881 RepID=UPI003D0E4FBD